jgi:hypothetical protein
MAGTQATTTATITTVAAALGRAGGVVGYEVGMGITVSSEIYLRRGAAMVEATAATSERGVVVTLVTSLLRLGARKFVSLMGKRERSSFQPNSGKARHLD